MMFRPHNHMITQIGHGKRDSGVVIEVESPWTVGGEEGLGEAVIVARGWCPGERHDVEFTT